MGQESSTNGNINNERLQTEYNNTMKEKEDYNINVNKSFYTPGMENLNKNHKELFTKYLTYLKNKENTFIKEVLSYVEDFKNEK